MKISGKVFLGLCEVVIGGAAAYALLQGCAAFNLGHAGDVRTAVNHFFSGTLADQFKDYPLAAGGITAGVGIILAGLVAKAVKDWNAPKEETDPLLDATPFEAPPITEEEVGDEVTGKMQTGTEGERIPIIAHQKPRGLCERLAALISRKE